MAAKKKADAPTLGHIPAPNFQQRTFLIEGTAPYVQCKFSQKVKDDLEKKHKEGSTAVGKKKREPRDFEEEYREAMHRGQRGEHGIPASAFRNAMISACRTVNFQMTRAKLAVFIETDIFDKADGTPLIPITSGNPTMAMHNTRTQTGVVNLRARPMWSPGWQAKVTIRWDADMFSANDVQNLLTRVGMQVGVGEGRPDSKQSTGMGWGLFRVVSVD